MDVVALLADRSLTHRAKLAILRAEHMEAIRALHDDDFVQLLREIRKHLSSPKLAAARDAFLEELRQRPANPRPLAAVPAPSPPPDPIVAATGTQLEAAIAADPQARDAYLVYGDWLQERGDPRGELIAIGAARAKHPSDRAMEANQRKLLADHPALLGELRHATDVVTEVQWYYGFIRSCRVSYTSARFAAPAGRRKPTDLPDIAIPDVIGWLLDDPGPARFLQELTVGLVRHDINKYAGVTAVLARRIRPTLRTLVLGDFTRDECELNWSDLGDLSALWPAVPGLKRLELRGGAMGLSGIRLPALEQLTTITGNLDPVSARAIADADWPALTRLSLQYGPESVTGFDAIAPLLAGTRLPRLRHLGITNYGDTDEVCDALPRAAILPRLAELDLSMGTMSEVGAAVLLREAGKFAHLARIELDDNYLPLAAREPLLAALPNVRFGDQRQSWGGERVASAFE